MKLSKMFSLKIKFNIIILSERKQIELTSKGVDTVRFNLCKMLENANSSFMTVNRAEVIWGWERDQEKVGGGA